MKLTPVKDKLRDSMWDSIYSDVRNKTYNSTSWEVRQKIDNEIRTPNRESIQEIHNPNFESISMIQRRTLDNLQNEINSNK